MTEIFYRLVFETLEKDVDIQKTVTLIRNKTVFDKEHIEKMLASSPRVLLTSSKGQDLKKVQTSLMKTGCRTKQESLVGGASYPFPIPEQKYKLLKQELSKVLRAKSSLVLFLVELEPAQSGEILPSLMSETVEQSLAEHLRESDSVFVIDDNRILILGFSIVREHAGQFRDKISDILSGMFDEKAVVDMGFSVFPDEARNLPKLISIAESKMQKKDISQDAKQEPPATPYVLARQEGTLTPIQVCFTEARGKIFKRLLSMDPQSLLFGLSQLPNEKQREFLARLPFDSPLAPILKDAIEMQSQPELKKVAQEDLETIIYYMEMEEGLADRKKNQETLLTLLNRTEGLPTLPSVASRVLAIASNPDSSANDLTEVIVNDPSLTSKLLKVVNSAFYGFRQKIGAVKQAVVLLGTGEIVALAFGIATAKLFNASHLKGAYSPQALWRHSMCTGLISEMLCKKFPEFKKLGVFTAGLLHDFGKILFIEKFSDHYGQIHSEAKKYDLPLFELEEEKFGLNHAIIGEFLATNWNLPEPLVQAIAFHHQPFAAASYSQLAAIIGLADYLYYEVVSSGSSADEFFGYSCELTSCHWTFLSQLFPGFDTTQLKEMVREARQVVENSQSLFITLT